MAEIQARPALPEDEPMRVLGDFSQRLDVPAVLGPADDGRQLPRPSGLVLEPLAKPSIAPPAGIRVQAP